MYLDFFRLNELPFRLSPDPQFLYLSKNHARAKAYMESTIWFTDGFVVITGEVGSGKTTLIESFLRDLGPEVIVAQINQTQVTTGGFLQSLLVQFGFKPFKMKKAELLATVNQFLIDQYAAGRKVLLIIDEAQNLSSRVLEEVRMLSGVETTREKTLRIILAGQPELNQTLDAPDLVQLTQRVRLRFHLTALKEEETIEYIRHRLEVAGAEGRALFTPEALEVVYRYTGGIPRLINTLCDTALMSAFAVDAEQVDLPEMMAAIEELQWVEFAARTGRMPQLPEEISPSPAATSTIYGRVYVSTLGRTIADRRLGLGRLTIGRTPDNDLQIDSKFISRHHCQLLVTAEETVIEDLQSSNGMLYQGQRVVRHVLKDGDLILFGHHTLTYIDERPFTVGAASQGAPATEGESTGTVHTLVIPKRDAHS
jgi:type II secretory pathway predicted ATPase ExeA